jgi:hypothetical protein
MGGSWKCARYVVTEFDAMLASAVVGFLMSNVVFSGKMAAVHFRAVRRIRQFEKRMDKEHQEWKARTRQWDIESQKCLADLRSKLVKTPHEVGSMNRVPVD